MKVDFYLKFHTKFGQKLFITGNIPALGNSSETDFIPMSFLNVNYWHLSIEVDEAEFSKIQYQYVFLNEHNEYIKEAEKHRNIPLSKVAYKNISAIDTWNDTSSIENTFYTAPFERVLLPNKKDSKPIKWDKHSHIFKVKAPLLNKDEIVCLLGNDDKLSNWEITNPIKLQKVGEWWKTKIDLSEVQFPIAYKYGVYDCKKEVFVRFEDGDNRVLHADGENDGLTVVHDGFINLPNNTFRGAGVAIPVFSLKSGNSFGVGEFSDIKLLVDWAVQTNLKLIQVLPVNDTSATFTWVDSYPYAAISAFALHPIYINLQKVAGKQHASAIRSLAKKQKQLNSLPDLDYESVIKFKMSTLRELYDMQSDEFLKNDDYKKFYNNNKNWLVPYAAFCVLRDRNGTVKFNEWKTCKTFDRAEIERFASPKSRQYKNVGFYFFVQYHLHLQLKEAANYAHKKGVVLKGDIPIGIYRDSVDAWVEPELYNMDKQAGAPPDDFAVKGQNWGFPTYNWQKMQENNFEWWRKRFEQMSHYFDVFRIDHILGFFRIWSIPIDAVEGILGVFVPALPLDVSEFGERGIWFDHDRFCKPYITDAVLNELFGANATFIKQNFLVENEIVGYELKDEFDSQQKIEKYFSGQDDTEENNSIKIGLFDLVSNVILFEEAGSDRQKFHFRISVEHTTSFQHLDDATKHKVKELYINYFYRRQDEFWKQEALRKLPSLKEATNMLVCGEDLGMVPHSVPDVMRRLAILSLEIQRMPKDPTIDFFHPSAAPYLSVITPSTHDMSTIRGWWEESMERTQKFYNVILEEGGAAPYFCEAWINRAIVLQHLYSPAMWSIFQLQDILGMSETLRRENPHEERINQPANPKHYWRYRMHITLEDLIKETAFNNEFKEYITYSGR